MSFTSLPPAAPRRIGRGLRIFAAIVVVCIGAALLTHFWWLDFWDGDEAPAESPIRPAHTKMDKYRIEEPAAEVVPAVLPAARPQAQPVERIQEQRPQPRRMTERTRRDPIHIGEVAWNLGATEIQHPEFLDGRQPLQGLGCSLRLGQSFIPAVSIDAIYSEIGGQVVAQVTQDIRSPDIGYTDKVLVPQGTRIVGNIVGTQELTIDRGRLAVVWSQMSHPHGFGGDLRYTQISLGESGGASADGSGGLGGDVRLNWGNIFLYAALVTVFNIAQNEAFEDNDYGDEAASTVGRLGNEILRKSLDFKPKIAIDAGTPVQIKIQRTTRVC